MRSMSPHKQSTNAAQGFCLRSKAGRLYPSTFAVDPGEAWVHAFDRLAGYRWMRPFWKRWDESQEAARKRGWEIVRVRLSPVRQ